jgi:hypothetical protein
MPKLNVNGYVSLWDYFSGRQKPTTHHLASIQSPTNYSFLMGGMQPLADIWKEVADTFKPYKSRFHFKREIKDSILGIFYGVGNIVKGIATLVGTIFALIFFLGRALLEKERRQGFTQEMLKALIRCTAWFCDGLFGTIKGVAQLLSPLKLIRIPLRSLITAYVGSPAYHENTSVEKAAEQGLAALESLSTDEAEKYDNTNNNQMKIIYKCAMEINRKHEKAKTRDRNISKTPAVFVEEKTIERELRDTAYEGGYLVPSYKKELDSSHKDKYKKGFEALLSEEAKSRRAPGK